MYFVPTISRICLRYCFEFTDKRLLITTPRVFRLLCIERVIWKSEVIIFRIKINKIYFPIVLSMKIKEQP